MYSRNSQNVLEEKYLKMKKSPVSGENACFQLINCRCGTYKNDLKYLMGNSRTISNSGIYALLIFLNGRIRHKSNVYLWLKLQCIIWWFVYVLESLVLPSTEKLYLLQKGFLQLKTWRFIPPWLKMSMWSLKFLEVKFRRVSLCWVHTSAFQLYLRWTSNLSWMDIQESWTYQWLQVKLWRKFFFDKSWTNVRIKLEKFEITQIEISLVLVSEIQFLYFFVIYCMLYFFLK